MKNNNTKIGLPWLGSHSTDFYEQTLKQLWTRSEHIPLVKVDVVMDAVGADTFEGSLDSLRPLGMMISFGNASGPVPPFSVGILGQKGSLKITRPTLFTHIAEHETCQAMAKQLFGKVTSGDVKIRIDQRFALEDVAAAHEALEARKTTGSTILTL